MKTIKMAQSLRKIVNRFFGKPLCCCATKEYQEAIFACLGPFSERVQEIPARFYTEFIKKLIIRKPDYGITIALPPSAFLGSTPKKFSELTETDKRQFSCLGLEYQQLFKKFKQEGFDLSLVGGGERQEPDKVRVFILFAGRVYK